MPRSMESGKDEGLQRMGDGKSKDGGNKKKKKEVEHSCRPTTSLPIVIILLSL